MIGPAGFMNAPNTGKSRGRPSNDIYVECCKRKCKDRHWESERDYVVNEKETKGQWVQISDSLCPKCGNKEYYKIDAKQAFN